MENFLRNGKIYQRIAFYGIKALTVSLTFRFTTRFLSLHVFFVNVGLILIEQIFAMDFSAEIFTD